MRVKMEAWIILVFTMGAIDPAVEWEGGSLVVTWQKTEGEESQKAGAK